MNDLAQDTVVAALALALLALAPAAGAQAHSDGPTARESLEIADRWAAREVPHLPNHCSGGRVTITRSDAAVAAVVAETGWPLTGFADGWVASGDSHEWDHAKCSWTTLEGLSPAEQCATDAHEQMHFVIGPQHEGPLDPRHPGPVECFTHSDAPTSRKKARRTRAQIHRSIRHRRNQARAAMRRIHRTGGWTCPTR